VAKIFLVDDEKHILEAYSEELSDDVHQVVSIDSADNLLRKISLHNPDLVVLDLDIRLVEWDGLELLQDIRNTYYNLPVIFCSAYDTYRHDPRPAAANYYVIKAFDLSELKTKIRMAMETHTLS
jgi:two-component system response regulator (stage 0 sporulation protein F)